MKNKPFIRFLSDADSLRQHCLRANYSAYLMCHPSLKPHISPLGPGWEPVGGPSRPVRHTRPALPTHLPAPGPEEENGKMTARLRDMMMYREEGRIYWNLMIQNIVRQNALIRAYHIFQCQIDSSATMSSQCEI